MDYFSNERVKGYLRTKGQSFVNEDDKEVILRGWATSNWMAVEGFTTGAGLPGQFDEIEQSGMSSNEWNNIDAFRYTLPRNFENMRSYDKVVRELCGETYAKSFWLRWAKNYITEEDIRYMSQLGNNSIRLVLSHRMLLEEEPGFLFRKEGFEIIDNVLSWCEKYRIYAVLDLHTAISGQTGLFCDDGIDNIPHLFIDEEAAERTIVLWEKIAERYKEKWIIAGYELLNEPLARAHFDYLIPELTTFYETCVERIRNIDQKHIIFLEGNRAGAAYDVFTKNFDPQYNNWCIAPHRYSGSPEKKTIDQMRRVSALWNVPLWISETAGVDTWNAAFFELLNEYHISYNLWTWKATNEPRQLRAPLFFELPEQWEDVKKYGRCGGPKPSYARSQKIFDALLENAGYNRCTQNAAVSAHLARRTGAVIPAIAYDTLPGRGISFRGSYDYDIPFDIRYGEQMEIFRCPDPANPLAPRNTVEGCLHDDTVEAWLECVLRLRKDDFVCYTLREKDRHFLLKGSVLAETNTVLRIENLSGEVIARVTFQAQEDFMIFSLCQLPPAEKQTVKLVLESGTMVLRSIILA